MEDQYVAHGAVHRRGHSDLQAKMDHATGEPADLERFAALQVVVHGCGHFRRPAVEERNALLGVVRGQLHAMGTPTATTSRARSSRNSRASGLARIGPMVLRMAVVAPDIATSTTYFSQIERRTSSLISALMPPRLQAS